MTDRDDFAGPSGPNARPEDARTLARSSPAANVGLDRRPFCSGYGIGVFSHGSGRSPSCQRMPPYWFAGIARYGAERRGVRKGTHGGVARVHPGEIYSPVLYTCNSSTIPSFPPPKTTIRSLMATARWPCLGRGWGPVGFAIRFHFSMGAAMMTVDHIIFSYHAIVQHYQHHNRRFRRRLLLLLSLLSTSCF